MREVSIPGLFWRPVRMAAVWVVFLVSLLVASWVINGFTFFVFTDRGMEGLVELQDEVMAEIDRIGALQPRWRSAAVGAANGLYGWVLGGSGVHEMGLRYADPSQASIPDTIVRRAYAENWVLIQSAMISTQIFAVRLVAFASLLPLGALAYLVGMTDGLVTRAVRRMRGGRESSSIYHRTKYLQLILVCGNLAVATLPARSISMDALGFVLATAPGLVASWQWRFYKKHL